MELLNFSDAVHELTDSPQVWESWGIAISTEQAAMLVQHQRAALRDTGRVDFGDGVLKKLTAAFCDSPYIQANDWADTLAQLTELFYTLKNETRDQLGDDALIGRHGGPVQRRRRRLPGRLGNHGASLVPLFRQGKGCV